MDAYIRGACVRLGIAGTVGRGGCGVLSVSQEPGVGQRPALPSRAGRRGSCM